MKYVSSIGISFLLLLSACSLPFSLPNKEVAPAQDEGQVRYFFDTLEECAKDDFICGEGSEVFFDAKGCGCKKMSFSGEDGFKANIFQTPSEKACNEESNPVCGVKEGGELVSFENACEAEKDGVIVFTEGACEETVSECPSVYMPVCAEKEGRKETYSNECLATLSGANTIYSGICDEMPCPLEESPVCGMVFPICVEEGVCGEDEVQPFEKTFQNECFAQKAGATNIYDGVCKK